MHGKDGCPALQEVDSLQTLQPWETPVVERSRFGSNGSSSSSAWRQSSGSSVGVPQLRIAGGPGGSMEQRRPSGGHGSYTTRSASDSGFTVTSTSTERTGSRIGSSRVGSTSSAASVSSDSGRPSSASASSSVSPSFGRSAGTSPAGAHRSYAGGGGGLGEVILRTIYIWHGCRHVPRRTLCTARVWEWLGMDSAPQAGSEIRVQLDWGEARAGRRVHPLKMHTWFTCMFYTYVVWSRYPAQLHRTPSVHAMLLIGTRSCLYTRTHPHAHSVRARC